jgi:hypothetical protein
MSEVNKISLAGIFQKYQLSGYPQFSKSDKEKCIYFGTPSAKTLHFFVIKIRETLINKWF